MTRPEMLTTPESVVTRENENPLSPGGFLLELAGLEAATSWVRSRTGSTTGHAYAVRSRMVEPKRGSGVAPRPSCSEAKC